jgi:hypothetical protein
MEAISQFKSGDRVVHTRRREWGQGVVEQATNIKHDGQPAQRLVVQFRNKGRVTVNTAIAPLAAADVSPLSDPTPEPTPVATPAPANDDSMGGWLNSLSSQPRQTALWKLPDAMTDPFASGKRRLLATLESCRFDDAPTNPRSMLEWAMNQTGLDDPLSVFSRPEIEQAWPRFKRDRDAHLVELAQQLRRKGENDTLREVAQAVRLNNAARNALEKALRH